MDKNNNTCPIFNEELKSEEYTDNVFKDSGAHYSCTNCGWEEE